MPQQNVEIFRSVLKRSVWISALWLNAGMFTYLDSGITNDVIGQVMTISVLIVLIYRWSSFALCCTSLPR